MDKQKKNMRRTLLNDIVFKIVFGSPTNEKLLRSLLNAVLDLSGKNRIVQLTLLSGELTKAHLFQKGVVLDVRAQDGQGQHYNIEVQVREEDHYVERSLYYLSKLYGDQLERGGDYTTLRRCVAISILDFALFPDIPALHTRFRFRDPVHEVELSDMLEIHYLELTKFRRDQPLVTPLEKWLHVLKFAELYGLGLEELPDSIQTEEEIVMALDAMNKAYATDEVRELIDARLKAEWDENTRVRAAVKKGVAKGLAEAVEKAVEEAVEKAVEEAVEKAEKEGEARGEAQGEARVLARALQEKVEIAKKLAALGIDSETILQTTGIQLEATP